MADSVYDLQAKMRLDPDGLRAIVLGPDAWLANCDGRWVPRPDLVDRQRNEWLSCGTYEEANRAIFLGLSCA